MPFKKRPIDNKKVHYAQADQVVIAPSRALRRLASGKRSKAKFTDTKYDKK